MAEPMIASLQDHARWVHSADVLLGRHAEDEAGVRWIAMAFCAYPACRVVVTSDHERHMRLLAVRTNPRIIAVTSADPAPSPAALGGCLYRWTATRQGWHDAHHRGFLRLLRSAYPSVRAGTWDTGIGCQRREEAIIPCARWWLWA